jgi:geranylgeranyl reductase family protein
MYDAAIIGTGPGGGMAACRLASSGLRVLLLEKETHPRHKPCGGGLTASVADTFPGDLSSLVEQRVTRVRRLYNFERPHEAPARSPILMVNRRRFDAYLVETAVAEGRGNVEIREGVRVQHVAEEADRVVIECEGGETVAASYAIAADGASSKTARSLSLGTGAAWQGVALDAEIAVTPEVWEQEKDRSTFNFFCVPRGYGWIFPKRDTLSCGVGVWRAQSAMRQALDEFLKRSFPPGSILEMRVTGHPIPLHHERRTLATRRVCLVGDAASLVDPVMGEGIRFALQSGAIAADVIMELLGAAPPSEDASEASPEERDCRLHQHRIGKAIGEKFEALQIAQTLFLEAPEYFYEQFILGGRNYSHLSQRIARQMQALRSSQ